MFNVLQSIPLLLFVLFGAMALGFAVAMVAQRNPLYSAISLVGVFVSLACLYLTLHAPFIAAIQVIVYAGAIMVLVIFVIMLLNVDEEVRRPVRLHYLIPVGMLLAAVLVGEAAFMLSLGTGTAAVLPTEPVGDVGLTASIGTGMFTKYLLPFEVTSVLILMALVGAITLARQGRTPLLAAPGSVSEEPPVLVAGGDLALKPGDTAATGRAYAREQIRSGDAAAPSNVPRRGEEEP
ncbi:MAG: NADH-quinone oxidoreductase subunit J [Pyrinomonadaceae bacterium]